MAGAVESPRRLYAQGAGGSGMRLTLLAVVIISAGLAGCADREEAISARDGLGPAREAARAHGDDPVLVGIMSIEPFKHMAEEDFEVWIHLDKNPGDGKAPGWMYLFVSGDRTIGIAYAAGMGVIAEGYEAGDWADAAPALADWPIDSTEVARLLARHEGWPAASDDTSVFWELRQEDEGPVWSVEWENATTTVHALVDARTGNVSRVEAMAHEATASTCAASGSRGGDVRPLLEQAATIEVLDGGGLTYSYAWDMTLGSAEMTLTGPDGELDSETLSGTGKATASLHDLSGGTHTLAIKAPLGVGEATDIEMWTCGD